ncbi:MAG TPA: MBL fold metallo-hydrolase [Chloroflexi bacterium]|nr:MBL fold metallo-hydrolase [Chloroflexota bacterium]
MPASKWHDFGDGTAALIGGSNIGCIIQGDHAILIDAGLDADTAHRASREVTQMGGKIEAVALTHGHADHFGGAAWIERSFDAPVYAAPLEGAFATHPSLEPLMLYGGAAPIRELRGKFTLAREGVPVIHPLNPGPTQIGGIPLEVMALPGHSPSQIGFVFASDQNRQTCFCGDAVFPPATLARHPILFCADVDAWLETLQWLATSSYERYIAGHGDPVTDIRPLVESTSQRLHELRELVHETLKAAPQEPFDVLRAVATRYGIDFTAPQFFLLSLTAINAMLSSLQRADAAEVVMEHNRMLWYAK